MVTKAGVGHLGPVLLVSVLVLVGCGSDDDGESSPSAIENSVGVSEPSGAGVVQGCEGGWTDPNDLRSDRQVARCDPGAPAPRPLAERAELVVAVTTTGAEFVAPLLLADEDGAFGEENLDVEIKVLPPPEALNLLSQGRVHVWLSSPDAAFHNAVNQGFDVRWVAGNFFEQATSKSGLWTRSGGSGAIAADLRGSQIATVTGAGSVIMYPISETLDEQGLGVSDVAFKMFPAPDVVTALENGAVDGAWLLTPAWQQVAGDADYTFLGGQPPGEPLGGVVFGSDLRSERREVGEAFLRAYIRTINTHFTGEYKQDPAFVEKLSELTGVPVDSLEATDALVFDWEIRVGTSTRMQEIWRQTEAIDYSDTLGEDEVVDRSVYEAVVGHEE